MDIGLATSTPPVDQEPAAGLYAGIGRFGRVCTRRTPVIFILLGVDWKAGAGRAANGANFRKSLRRIPWLVSHAISLCNNGIATRQFWSVSEGWGSAIQRRPCQNRPWPTRLFNALLIAFFR